MSELMEYIMIVKSGAVVWKVWNLLRTPKARRKPTPWWEAL